MDGTDDRASAHVADFLSYRDKNENANIKKIHSASASTSNSNNSSEGESLPRPFECSTHSNPGSLKVVPAIRHPMQLQGSVQAPSRGN